MSGNIAGAVSSGLVLLPIYLSFQQYIRCKPTPISVPLLRNPGWQAVKLGVE
jgi:hypothetical protein